MLKTKKGTSIWGADKIERTKLSPDSKTISTLVYNYKPPNLSSAKIIDLETNRVIIARSNIRNDIYTPLLPRLSSNNNY